MNEERRGRTTETILVSLGRLEETVAHIKQTAEKLDVKVGIQNGKVGRIELWQSRIQGILFVVLILVVPIVINFVSSWLRFTFQIQ